MNKIAYLLLVISLCLGCSEPKKLTKEEKEEYLSKKIDSLFVNEIGVKKDIYPLFHNGNHQYRLQKNGHIDGMGQIYLYLLEGVGNTLSDCVMDIRVENSERGIRSGTPLNNCQFNTGIYRAGFAFGIVEKHNLGFYSYLFTPYIIAYFPGYSPNDMSIEAVLEDAYDFYLNDPQFRYHNRVVNNLDKLSFIMKYEIDNEGYPFDDYNLEVDEVPVEEIPDAPLMDLNTYFENSYARVYMSAYAARYHRFVPVQESDVK